MANQHEELWSAEETYVVGHQRPDMDAIASAVGYAWLLTELGRERVVPARAGGLPAQAVFALQRFGVEPPRLLSAVAPTFGHAARFEEPVPPDAPLTAALARIGQGTRVVPVVDAHGKTLGVVTPMALVRALEGARSADRLSAPCREFLETVPTVAARERISDHRSTLLRSDADDLLVTDEQGRYAGIATRARILDPPRARLILVDHNELSQAVPGADEAEIVEVLDHHRLGNPPTAAPIPFRVEPVGSTSTLVAEDLRRTGRTPPPGIAGLLLSGLLSDTLLFRSPTTTGRDREAAAWLAEQAGVDLTAYGEELLRSAPGLAGRDPDEVLDADRKTYEMRAWKVSIAQVEVTSFADLRDAAPALLPALEEHRRREGLALLLLMVTDVVAGRSRLLGAGEPRLLRSLPLPHLREGEWDAGTMVSRKKQLVPLLHDLLENA